MYDVQYPRFSDKLEAITDEIVQQGALRQKRADEFRARLQDFRARFRRVTTNRLLRLRVEGIFIRRPFLLDDVSEQITEDSKETEASDVKAKTDDALGKGIHEAEKDSSKVDEKLSIDEDQCQQRIGLSRAHTTLSDYGNKSKFVDTERKSSISGKSTPKLIWQNSLANFRRVGRKVQNIRRFPIRRENTFTVFTPMSGLEEEKQLRVNSDETLSHHQNRNDYPTRPNQLLNVSRKWRFAVGRNGLGNRGQLEVCASCGKRHRTAKEKMRTASVAINCAKCFQKPPK